MLHQEVLGQTHVEEFPLALQERLLSVKEVAEILQVPPSWVYERTRRRSRERIPGIRLGKYWRFRLRDVLGWLEEQKRV